VATLSSDSRPIIARGPSLFARLLFLGALSVAIMAVDHRQQYLSGVRDFLSRVVYPLQALVGVPANVWDWSSRALVDRDALKQENERLRAELRTANLDLLRMQALTQENLQLRAIREASSSMQYRSMITEIMRVDVDPYRHRVFINHGAKDGLYKGQPLLDASGVFGQITRVGRYASEALLITDAEHATPIRVNRTGLRSIAVGIGDIKKLSLPYITSDADIKAGDLLVTSGLGGIYPSGYPVAEITHVETSPTQTFATVEAKPLAELDRARELILLWFEPPATDDLEEDAKKPATQAKANAKSSDSAEAAQ